jgi:protein-S-isoprenylcysteine O-methyltransferase Ste14
MFRQLRALLLPITVDGLIPLALLYFYPPSWDYSSPPRWLLAAAGLALLAGGLWLLAQTIRLLVVEVRGTLAPWDPTQRLVVRGIYRHDFAKQNRATP